MNRGRDIAIVVVLLAVAAECENAGLASMDRGTEATLSTYTTWIQVSRLQKSEHSQRKKLRITTTHVTVSAEHAQKGRDPMLVLLHGGGGQRCLASMGSD